RHRPHPRGGRGARRLPGAHAEWRPLRPAGGRMKRALVTLGHPDHAGMLRALRMLDDAAPRHGWELRFVLAGPHPQVAEEGLAAERVTYLPALRRWRAWPARLALPAAVLRLARLARGADVLYACTLSSFPYCLLARPRARVVYNGMDVDRIARAAAAPLPEGVALGGGPTVGMVGHLDARKNPAVLVEAMAEVRAAVPGARALLVGAFRDPAYERSV